METTHRRAPLVLPWARMELWTAPVLLAICVAIFYAPPLLSTNASIQWDAANVHFPLQKYCSERLLKSTPFWTPYLLSGYPILANPETEAFYPLNWPFYLFGFRPGSVEGELALHAFLACLGAYLFFSQLRMRSSAAMLGAMAYGLSGYFAGHSSHVPVFLSAAWFPWLLWAYRRAVTSDGIRSIAAGALAGGMMLLAGYYQVAVLAFAGLFCYAAADAWFDGKHRRRIFRVCTGMTLGAMAVSAVVILPALELLANAVPAAPDASREIVKIRALGTLLWPNAAGTISSKDTGLVTDHYLYAGLALIPLAIVGALRPGVRRYAAVLGGFSLLCMLGPYGGLYFATRLSPAMLAGPPDLAWFPAALALALLAAAGSDHVFRRAPAAGVLLAILTFADLWYCNMLRNPLAYARASFSRLYGYRERAAAYTLGAPLLPLTRFDAPAAPPAAGPLLHPLDIKMEATYGYFLLQPRPYADYFAAMGRNHKLRDGLNVARFVNLATKQLETNPGSLPRAYFPGAVRDVADEEASRRALESANPADGSTVLGPHPPIIQEPLSIPFVTSYDEQGYRIHYAIQSPGLLKLAASWFPGWRARVDGVAVPVLRVDHALIGAVVPAGAHTVEFRFRSNWFITGFAISFLTLICLAIMAAGLRHRPARRSRRSRRDYARVGEINLQRRSISER